MVPTSGEGSLPPSAFRVYTIWAAAANNQERAISAQPRLAASRRLAARAQTIVLKTRATKMPMLPKAWEVGEELPSMAR